MNKKIIDDIIDYLTTKKFDITTFLPMHPEFIEFVGDVTDDESQPCVVEGSLEVEDNGDISYSVLFYNTAGKESDGIIGTVPYESITTVDDIIYPGFALSHLS